MWSQFIENVLRKELKKKTGVVYKKGKDVKILFKDYIVEIYSRNYPDLVKYIK